MDAHLLTSAIAFFVLFFGAISFIQIFSKRTTFPFTVALLIAGFIAQVFVYSFGLHTEFHLDPQTIYYLILPILLFEAAMHINIHQFRIQFLTISFISTFGLLVSMGVIAVGLTLLIGMPFEVALLFGALISATDPIAVLSLFKTLGAPKRLSLIADGESMFNDATAVIAYKIVAGFIFATTVTNSSGQIFTSLGNFAYMFFGSIIFGIVLGYFSSLITRRINNDHLVETTITIALALGSFIVADHYFGMSGVITTVMAGVAFGNLGKTNISRGVRSFVNEAWEYLAFLSISLVFFFAAYQLNIVEVLSYGKNIVWVILMVLIARAFSVYFSFGISNKLPFFKNEPNIPLSWQHILNWGGLRGVIPLVLAYSLPDDFIYKNEIIAYTLATFIFTLLVNGLTIRWLLVKLKLHLPKHEEEIIAEELQLFKIEQKRSIVKNLIKDDFNQKIISVAEKHLVLEEELHKNKLLEHANKDELERSLRLESIEIARKKMLDLFYQGYVNEAVIYEHETLLDLQQDAVEYPEVYQGRGYESGGHMPNRKLYRDRLRTIRNRLRTYPYLRLLFGKQEHEVVVERLMSLKSKAICVKEILDYFEKVSEVFKKEKWALAVIKQLEVEYKAREVRYKNDLKNVVDEYPEIMTQYQQNVLSTILN